MGRCLRAERGAQHLLGRGLADAAGDRGEAPGEARPPGGAEAGQASQGVVHAQRRAGRIGVDHGAGRAARDRVGDMRVAVAMLAAQGDEQIARRDGAGVDRDAGGVEWHR